MSLPGKLLYNLWHRPASRIRDSLRNGGPWQERRTARGRGEMEAAARIEKAVSALIKEGKDVTYDLGGTAGTKEFADAIIKRMRG